MATVKIYGIKNCDTMKKAFKWLEENGVDYDFHDFKKSGVPEDVIKNAIDEHGWEVVINKRGTTWRKLDEDLKTSMDAQKALACVCETPSFVKRPLFLANNSYLIGFCDDTREKLFI